MRAHCEKAFECQTAYSPTQHLTDFRQVFKTSVAECETTWTMSAADLGHLDEAVSAQHIAYDRAASGRCFDDVARTSCNDWFNYDGFVTRPGTCDGMFAGRVSVGAACQLSFECVAGWRVRGSKRKERPYSEYWTFIRSSERSKQPVNTEAKCGNGGAPLSITMAGACAHCGAHVTAGEFDWVLSKIEQDDSYRG